METSKDGFEGLFGNDQTNSIIDDDAWGIEPMPDNLINSPLDFIFAEHYRQREAALMLTQIADGEFDKTSVDQLINFLEHDFAFHVMDEELGFFPILKECCQPEDNIDALILRLVEEHKKDESVSEDILTILRSIDAERSVHPSEARSLRAFAEHIQQHLAVENAVLLPIARVRMDEAALSALSTDMKQRRKAAH